MSRHHDCICPACQRQEIDERQADAIGTEVWNTLQGKNPEYIRRVVDRVIRIKLYKGE